MRFIVCRLPMTFDEPRWFVVDTVTWTIIKRTNQAGGPHRYTSFNAALAYARALERRSK